MTHVIEAEGLTKRFGDTQALAGVDLAADGGQVLALLGPNGAGKTTIVRILATLLKADSGRARISGYDVVRDAVQVRQLIGLTGQYASVDDELTGTENMILIGRLLGFSRAQAHRRATEVIEEFGLTEAGGRAAKTYSGGMRRRLDLAASLLGRPDVLADRIVVIDRGVVAESGTPAELKARIGGQSLEVRASDLALTPRVTAVVAEITGAVPEVHHDT